MDAVTLGLAQAAAAKRYRSKWSAERAAIPILDTALPSTLGTPPTRAITAGSVTSPISGATTYTAYTSGVLLPNVTIRNAGRVSQVTQNTVNYAQNQANAGGSAPMFSVEGEFYGQDMTWLVDNILAGTTKVWLWVDGHPATAAPEVLNAGGTNGQVTHYRVTFPTTDIRRLRLWIIAGAFGGISYDPLAAYMAPTKPTRPRCSYFGDSWVGGALSVSSEQLMAFLIPRYLGWDPINHGQGGTGFTTAGPNGGYGAYTDATRLAEIVNAAPDYVIVQASQNDDDPTGTTASIAAQATAVGAAFTTVMNTLTAALPKAQFIVVSAPRINVTPPTTRTANNSAIQALVGNYPQIIGYYDAIAAGEYTGNGYAGHPNANGNAGLFVGSDQAHSTAAGHAYLSRVRAHAIAGLLAAKG